MPQHQSHTDLLKKRWTAFRQCLPDPRDPGSTIYRNSRYQVHQRSHAAQRGGSVIHLSFKRIDQGILIPYEDKLRIKNELVDPESEGVELLPARSREIDMANQYHLWVRDRHNARFPLSLPSPLPLSEPGSEQEGDLLKRSWTPLRSSEEEEGRIYHNSRYQVSLQRLPSVVANSAMIVLSVQRLDGSPLVPYRDRMRIKDELVGPECEGIELLPARSHALPSMNGCALWVVDDPAFRFPFGFPRRYVSDQVLLPGVVQEPWKPEERPADCLSEEGLRELLSQSLLADGSLPL